MNQVKRRVLFHRSWTIFNGGTSGGQIKVRDAFEHVKHAEGFEPKVFFGKDTVWYDNPGNVWLPYRSEAVPNWEIQADDILFFAGFDWKVLPLHQRQQPPVPILNIAQPRHTRPEDRRHSYLQHPAIRIAKSSIGKQILEDFGVNGPVYLIPDAIDLKALPAPHPNPDLDILIVGLKNPDMAKRLQARLEQRNRFRLRKLKVDIQVPPKLPTRMDFIHLLNRCKIAVFLPLDAARGAEGFYLPALEAMVMQKLVICPYAVGNIDFCIPDQTCIQPEYHEDAIYQAILQAIKMPKGRKAAMKEQAKNITYRHDLKEEKKAYLQLLSQTDEIWQIGRAHV